MSILNFWKKQTVSEAQPKPASNSITWDTQAEQALTQALAQAPVPAMMKGMVKKQLKAAAEEYTKNAGRNIVTAQDLMAGMMAKMPDSMKAKVEAALKKGPEGLADLQKEIKP